LEEDISKISYEDGRWGTCSGSWAKVNLVSILLVPLPESDLVYQFITYYVNWLDD
jgi:hypothetical protein